MIQTEEDLPLLPKAKVSIIFTPRTYNFLLRLSAFLSGVHVLVVKECNSPAHIQTLRNRPFQCIDTRFPSVN